MQKKLKRNNVFTRTRERLSKAIPKAAASPQKMHHHHAFSESRDVRENRGIRQMKAHQLQTFPHADIRKPRKLHPIVGNIMNSAKSFGEIVDKAKSLVQSMVVKVKGAAVHHKNRVAKIVGKVTNKIKKSTGVKKGVKKYASLVSKKAKKKSTTKSVRSITKKASGKKKTKSKR